MKSELIPPLQRPSLDEYETLYTQAEELLASPNVDLNLYHKISQQLKIAVRKVGLNSQKPDIHLHYLNNIYEQISEYIYQHKPQYISVKRQPIFIQTNNEFDLYYLANSPLKRKADRVVRPLSETGKEQVARFEEMYQTRKIVEQQRSSEKPKRKHNPLYSKQDIKNLNFN